jgi:hypothetical protein
MKWLENYRNVCLGMFEDDEDLERLNPTDICPANIKLMNSITQLLPMDGKRVNIYRGIQMLYARYFDNHLSRN